MSLHTNQASVRITFYILKDSMAKTVVKTVCRLVEKSFQAGDWLYIQTRSDETLHVLNKYLWSYKQDSFLPHQIWQADVQHTEKTPILLGTHSPHDLNSNALLTLTGEKVSNPLKYNRILHVVTSKTDRLQSARIAFKQYQEKGLHPQYFTI